MLIVFDEIQACEEALNALKYFSENAPEFAIIAAGSLLGISLGSHKSFPVGKVEFLQLNPLTFFEYLKSKNLSLWNYAQTTTESFDALLPGFFVEFVHIRRDLLILVTLNSNSKRCVVEDTRWHPGSLIACHGWEQAPPPDPPGILFK